MTGKGMAWSDKGMNGITSRTTKTAANRTTKTNGKKNKYS